MMQDFSSCNTKDNRLMVFYTQGLVLKRQRIIGFSHQWYGLKFDGTRFYSCTIKDNSLLIFHIRSMVLFKKQQRFGFLHHAIGLKNNHPMILHTALMVLKRHQPLDFSQLKYGLKDISFIIFHIISVVLNF